ncbi:MAG: TRAP transporter substrate-binding protein, partial [Psychrobacter alimentarius]
QITELPGLSNSATQMGCMLQTLYEDGTLASEYKDTHMLFMYGAGPGSLHTTDKLIRTPADMKGMRIRRPSAVAGDIIESAGASPVGLPANDMYTSLQRGVVDGLSFPWEAVTAFKIDEITKYHTNIPFYSSALMVTMNKDKYDSLPDDLKQVLDKNSGMALANKVGEVFDKHDQMAIQAAKDKGDEIIEIPDPLNDPNWKGPLEKGTKKYLSDVKALGLDADSVYEKAKAASAACKV